MGIFFVNDHPFCSYILKNTFLVGGLHPKLICHNNNQKIYQQKPKAAENHSNKNGANDDTVSDRQEHTYLPILPNSFRWALESPAPFLMGISGSIVASELPDDVPWLVGGGWASLVDGGEDDDLGFLVGLRLEHVRWNYVIYIIILYIYVYMIHS